MAEGYGLAGPPNDDLLGSGPDILTPRYDERSYLDLFDKLKRESMEYRWVWEKDWMRDLFYVGNRHWIYYHPNRREWLDKRLQKWVPRPVTPLMASTAHSIRQALAAINLAVTVRPANHDIQSIAAAEVADQMAPLIHEEHLMNQVMREADFWLVVNGNACLQLSWDTDPRNNRTFVRHEQCIQCGGVFPPQAVVEAGQVCPACGNPSLTPATGPDGKPVGEYVSFGRGKTTALSPFEWAVPSNITRFDDLPYLIRLRWRDKHWFEANKPELVHKIKWEKSPTDRSLQIYKSLSLQNDISQNASLQYFGAGGGETVEGVTEYEAWIKPTPEFPDGLVLRVVGDKAPMLLDMPEEGIPGPFPYKDIEGNPLFPFCHAQYEHIGGRLYGRSAISPLIQKQDQINQIDSLIQLSIQRMANPVWVIPENAGIDHFTGEPGLIIKWNPLAAGGNAKPDRIPGMEIPGSLFQLREQLIRDVEEASGASDPIKGQKPAGVEAFSALQLLVERSQSRFTSVFQSRGEMYRKWFSIAIELERQFGPTQRVGVVVGPNKGYTFRHFQNAQLQGQISVKTEDGSNMPKTALGKRAAIQQANELRLLNPADPDQKYALLSQFGLSDLSPTLNTHVQAALQLQDEFERWAEQPQGPSPLVIKPWFDPHIHWVERIKWLNTDRMRELMAANPQIELVINAHLQQLQFLLIPPAPVAGPDGKAIAPSGPNAPGAGQALRGSNRESAGLDTLSGGNAPAPNQRPNGMMGPM